jgi:two-component system response regulator HydG
MAKPPKSETPADVLVVDDVREHAEVMAEGLARAGHRCETAFTGPDAVARLEAKHFDVVVTDLVLGGAVDGMAVLRAAHQANPETQVILVSAHGDMPTAFEAGRRGAYQFLEKPVDLDGLRILVNRAAEKIHQGREVRDVRRPAATVAAAASPSRGRPGFDGIIGESPALLQQLQRVRKIAPTKIPVLITGQNGTGKELVARALHALSPRAGKRFVAINCAGIPESLLEDELFGHVRGVFTDAKSDREGKFEYADGGTIFLDEIGDMPVQMQAKLLRVLELGEVTRLGANEPVHVDVRVVSATNQDLERLIAERAFRQDLYYRLKGVEIRMPSLAERRGDIPALAAHFLAEAVAVHVLPPRRFSPAVLQALEDFDWPGNVRELRRVVHQMAAEAEGEEITPAELPPEIRRPMLRSLPSSAARVLPALPAGTGAASPIAASQVAASSVAGASAAAVVEFGPDGQPLTELERLEREAIRRALEMCGGNRAKAAKQLGMGERTLYRKLDRYGLE